MTLLNDRKIFTSASPTVLKPVIVWMTTNCGKFLKRWEYQTTLPTSLEMRMQVKKQQSEPNVEKWTGSKLERSTTRLCVVTLLEMPSWMNHKLESGLPGRNSNFRYANSNTLMAESKEKLKSLLMRVMEELERAGLKLNIQQTNKQTNNSDHDIWPHYFLANRGGEGGSTDISHLLGL